MSALKAFLLLSLFWLSSVAGTPSAEASSATTLETRTVPVPQDTGNKQIVSCGGDKSCSNPVVLGVGLIEDTTQLIQVGLTSGADTTWTITLEGGGNARLSVDDGVYTGSSNIARNTPVYATKTPADDILWTFVPVDGVPTFLIQADANPDFFWTVNANNPQDPNYPEIIFDYMHSDRSGQYFQYQTVNA